MRHGRSGESHALHVAVVAAAAAAGVQLMLRLRRRVYRHFGLQHRHSTIAL
jgi:hypothetical protein